MSLGLARLRRSAVLARLRRSAVPILQCALAAGLAWLVAREVLGHAQPFFAPMAAVITLTASLGQRLRRSAELIIGVSVGIGVGDLLVALIGQGPWQIAVVVAAAMAVAVAIDDGPLLALQAGSSATLVVTLLPPGGASGASRMLDALVGGVMGIVAVALVPTHPLRRAESDAAAVANTLARVLHWTADGIRRGDTDTLDDALAAARGTQPAINGLRASVTHGAEVARISPMYWSARSRAARLAEVVNPLDNAMRNTRVLLRRAVVLVTDAEGVDPRLPDEIDALAQAAGTVRDLIAADFAQSGPGSDAVSVLGAVARRAGVEVLDADFGLSSAVVLAQIRSIVVDLMAVAGISRAAAVGSLPPTR